jgi:hypothetical protein
VALLKAAFSDDRVYFYLPETVKKENLDKNAVLQLVIVDFTYLRIMI